MTPSTTAFIATASAWSKYIDMPDTITLAHSPDSDDAFMFYGLATNKLDTGGLQFEHLLKDIQTLNEEAMGGT